MSRTRSRAVAALAAATLLLAGLTGCGSDSEPETAAGASADQAPGTTVEKEAFLDGLLAAVTAQKTARAELTLGTGITAEAAFRYGAQPAADLSFAFLGRTMHVVLVDELVYLQKAAGEKFVVLTQDDPSLEVLGGGFSELDPQKVLGNLSDGITEIREIGPTTIEGETLTRYAVTIDGQASGADGLAMLPGVDLSQGLTLDLYVDDDDLLHRVEADLGENDLTLVITDWGKPVAINAPPASQILKN